MDRIRTAVLGMLALGLDPAYAEPVDPHSLAQRHIEARGGLAALQGLKVIERYGSLTVHGATPEIQGTYHTCIQYPDRVAVDVKRSVTTVLTSATHTDSPSDWCLKRFSTRPAERNTRKGEL